MLRLNCFIQVKNDMGADVLAAARALTAESRRQEGCIAYDIFQSATRSDVMMICETWRDQAALDAHSASEPFKKYVALMRANADMKLETFSF